MDMAGLLGRLFRRQRTPELRCSAVVPAAGSSTRMEGQDKLLQIGRASCRERV